MENLNKDLGPVRDGCGARLFIWSRETPPPPPPTSPGCTCEVLGPAEATLCALPPSPSEGCVLFHINDKERSGSKKSLSYTHLFKKSQPHNTVGRSPQESGESRRGMRQWQKTEPTSLFFYPPTPVKQGLLSFKHRSSFTKTKTCFMHFNRNVAAQRKRHNYASTVTFWLLLSLQSSDNGFLLPPLG